MKNRTRYKGRQWKELASMLSDEKTESTDLLARFVAEEGSEIVKQWKGLRDMSDERGIDVDRAWNNVFARISTEGTESRSGTARLGIIRPAFLRIAAVSLIVLSLGAAALWLAKPDILSKKNVVATNSDQKNVRVELPDGSIICLNRNSELSYRSNFGHNGRNVSLRGEAFFDITPDKSKPFVIDAGKASIKVVGTSFNVISNNSESAVEVYVKTGKVLLSSKAGKRSLSLEPGYIGTMGPGSSDRKLNLNPNYLAWNTGLLVYNGQTLDIVISDLKRVYNMNIVADDPSILANRWTSPIDNQPQETIIRLICASFNLSYTREGDVYHLARK